MAEIGDRVRLTQDHGLARSGDCGVIQNIWEGDATVEFTHDGPNCSNQKNSSFVEIVPENHLAIR